MREHAQAGLVQVERVGRQRDPARVARAAGVAVHLRRLAEEDVHGEVDGVGFGHNTIFAKSALIRPAGTFSRKREKGWFRHRRRTVPDHQPLFGRRSEEHTSELQSLMRLSYAGLFL